MPSERQFIRSLQNRFPTRFPVETGIGDDGAVINSAKECQQIVVTDLLLDGTHFDLSATTPELIGRKALAVNLSDLAAMACQPTAAFVSIAIPRSLAKDESFLTRLYDGMEEFTQRYDFTIAGGDTNVWNGPFAINVCLTGVPMAKQAVLRSQALPGDSLFVTGPLGGSLHSGRHLTFEPKLETARRLVNQFTIHAMMDISDGLSIDLNRMMEASGTGTIIESTLIPIHHDVSSTLSAADRILHAMNDGEDFELLFAAPAFLSESTQPNGWPFIKIGHVTNLPGIYQIKTADGKVSNLAEGGWQHL